MTWFSPLFLIRTGLVLIAVGLLMVTASRTLRVLGYNPW